MRSIIPLYLSVFILSGCGGGSGDNLSPSITLTTSTKPSAYRVADMPTLPELESERVTNLPVTHSRFDGSRLRVGRNVVPDYPMYSFQIEDYKVYFGTRHEQLDGDQIRMYLGEAWGHSGLLKHPTPPTIHIGQDMGHRQNVLRAVQWINEVLPPEWHLQMGADVAPLTENVSSGEIYVDFGTVAGLGDKLPTGAAGVAYPYRYDNQFIYSGHIYIAPDRVGWHDPSDDVFIQKVIIHELLHSLGLLGHVDRQDSRLFDTTLGREDTATMLFPIDRQALFALYARLSSPVEDPYHELFGKWSTLGDHFVRKLDFSEFGVVRQSVFPGPGPAYTQGWAVGDAPYVGLAGSPLSGEVTWTGDLIGVRPEKVVSENGYPHTTVYGSAELSVDLESLEGQAVFDDLRTVGTGGDWKWGDGDLEYNIQVFGNTFYQTDDSLDAGDLTGVFAGDRHQEAVGVLERTDLTAAFGVSRD